MKHTLSLFFSPLPKSSINKVILCGRATSLPKDIIPQIDTQIEKNPKKEVHPVNQSNYESEFLLSVIDNVVDSTSADIFNLKNELVSYKVKVFDEENQSYLKTHLKLNAPVYVEGCLNYSNCLGQEELSIDVSNQQHGNILIFDSAQAILTDSLTKKRKKT